MAHRRIEFDDFGEAQTGSRGAELRRFLARAMMETAPWPFACWDAAELEGAWQAIAFHGCALAIVERQGSIDDWPEALREPVREEARLQALWEASHRQVLIRVLDAMAARAVDILVTKGSALAYSVFLDPAQRRRGDTDLLVRRDQLEQARQVLSDCGLTLAKPGALQEVWCADTPSGFAHQIDLHWHTTSTPALEAIFTQEEAFANSTSLTRLSAIARATDPVRTFLGDALNQALHAQSGYLVDGHNRRGRMRLIWSFGVKLQAEAFSQEQWQALVQLAVARGAAEMCLRSLEQAIADFGTPVPTKVLGELRDAGDAGSIDRVLFHFDGWEQLRAAWSSAPDWQVRGQLLRNSLLTNEDFLRRRYPGMARWPLAALRLRRIVGAAFRRLRAN